MKILITGGAGFIGSHLAKALVEKRHQIDIIDDFSTGRISNLSSIRDRIYIHKFSILDEWVVEDLIQQVDQIYHLAAVVGVKNVMERPVETLLINVRGTDIVLRLASKYQKKILITSTSEVYGKSNEFLEDSDRILGSVKKRRWAYSCSKSLDEFLALAYFDEKQLPVVIARLFNVAGPRQVSDYGMVLPTFVEQALSGQPITIHGDGSQTRSFCHVKDTVKMLVKLMNNPLAEGDIFNVGNDYEITISDLAHMVKEIAHSNSEIVYIPHEKVFGDGFEDMNRRRPNLSKTKALIGCDFNYTLGDIIQDVISEQLSKKRRIFNA
jgi:UDP-glucose 4-epimerase